MAATPRGSARYQRRAGELRSSSLPREAGMGVSELQRSRMLSSAVQVVMEQGYGQMSVARITGRAGVSRRTFYELFEDREACFLAAFDQAVAEMTMLATQAWENEASWREQVRAALGALLGFLDERPGVGSLVIVEALGAGPRVLAHRARVLAQLAHCVEQGHTQLGRRREPPPLTAEGVVGAVLAVVHARLLEKPPVELLSRLLNPLMGMILAPYLGDGAVTHELQRPTPRKPRPAPGVHGKDPLRGLRMRITYRTLKVLTVIGESPSASNRQVADGAGITDQGQISKLLARLETLGLIHNTVPGQPTGAPNQWHLTPQGEEVQQAIEVGRSATAHRPNGTKGVS